MEQTPALAIGFLVVFLPGVMAFAGVGVRGLALVAAAPLFGVFATGAVAVVISIVGFTWSPVSWAAMMLVVVLMTWATGWVLGRPILASVKVWRSMLPIALCVGALLVAWRLAAYIGDAEAISQTNDAVFHMNAVRYILETGDASSLHVSSVIGGAGFYPGAWHAIVSLVVQCTGASIPVAANAVTLLIGAVIWPLGIAWLTSLVTGSSTLAAYAAVLAGVMQNFPLLMFQWGVLFPNALSTALIPAAVALVILLPAWNHGSRSWQATLRVVLVVSVAGGALALSQPAALLAWAAICLVWLSFHLLRTPQSRRSWRSWTILAVVWLALAILWLLLSRSTSGSHWPFFRTRFEALADVVFNSHVMIGPQIGISILMVVGIIAAVRRPAQRWLAAAWLGVSVMYWLVAAVGNETVRNFVLGAWYADPYRIAAIVPVVVIPIAALGVDLLVRTVATRTSRGASVVARSAVAMLVVLVAALVLLRPTPLPSITARTYDPVSRYDSSATSYLSDDERSLLEQLDELVEGGARVIGNPSTGTGFGYFFSGVDVYPRTWSPPGGEEWQTLAEELRDAASTPGVCEALAAYGDAEYVLDFGPGEARAGRWLMPGMTDFEGQPGFVLVAQEGNASLWRITACGQ